MKEKTSRYPASRGRALHSEQDRLRAPKLRRDVALGTLDCIHCKESQRGLWLLGNNHNWRTATRGSDVSQRSL